MTGCHKLIVLAIFLQFNTFFSFLAFAQRDSAERKFYVGIDAGTGLPELSANGVTTERTAKFAFGLYGGYIPLKWLRTGIALNGWLIEPFGNFNTNPENGISISNVYAQVQLFPFEKCNLFANLSGGYTEYINHHPEEFNANGTGALIGLGYEKNLNKRLKASLLINYGLGTFKDVQNVAGSVTNQHYNVLEFLLGITWN
jgi:hypothetical protein